MSSLSQFATLNLIHHYCDIGVWTRMAIKFSERIAFVDDRTERFLRTVAHLGGYCTVEQAQAMGLAKSASHAQTHLIGFERAGLLRKVVQYPVVYQVTKSVVRLVGTDMSARRQHVVDTVRWRLASVNFYLDARKWPADFIFDHQEKVAALAKSNCPRHLLPSRGGQPYLWEDLIMDLGHGGVCVAIVDRPYWNALLQLLGFIRRFEACRSRAGERLSLAVAVASEARRELYEKAATHRGVVEHSKGASEPATVYRVHMPIPHIRTLTHEPVIHANHDSRRPIRP